MIGCFHKWILHKQFKNQTLLGSRTLFGLVTQSLFRDEPKKRLLCPVGLILRVIFGGSSVCTMTCGGLNKSSEIITQKSLSVTIYFRRHFRCFSVCALLGNWLKSVRHFGSLFSKPFVQTGSSFLIPYLFLEPIFFGFKIIFLNLSGLRWRSFLSVLCR